MDSAGSLPSLRPFFPHSLITARAARALCSQRQVSLELWRWWGTGRGGGEGGVS